MNKLEITADKTLIAAAGNPHVRVYSVASATPQPVLSYDAHTANVTAVGFHRDSKWMFTGSEDGTVKLWDLRAPGFQREFESRAAVNTVVLHPQQGELISGAWRERGGPRQGCQREVSGVGGGRQGAGAADPSARGGDGRGGVCVAGPSTARVGTAKPRTPVVGA